MKTAFIFPGQGSQYSGMAKGLYEKYDSIKILFNKANDILGFDITDICFNGTEEILKQTYITQPAIFIHSYAITEILGDKIPCDCSGGHSLGEYTALTFSGALDFETGLKLVKKRGELMQKAGETNKGTMAAIIGLERSLVDEICTVASKEGIVQPANYNSPGQLVISGTVPGVHRAMQLAKEHKAKLVKELVVHGAFHSPLMKDAGEGLKNELEHSEIKKLKKPIYRNVDGNKLTENSSPDEIRESLYKQLTSAVQWEDCIKNMVNDGVKRFIEIGPNKVLQGLVKRIDNSVEITGIDKAEDLEKLQITN